MPHWSEAFESLVRVEWKEFYLDYRQLKMLIPESRRTKSMSSASPLHRDTSHVTSVGEGGLSRVASHLSMASRAGSMLSLAGSEDGGGDDGRSRAESTEMGAMEAAEADGAAAVEAFGAALSGELAKTDAFYRAKGEKARLELAHMREDYAAEREGRRRGENRDASAVTAAASARAAYVHVYRELRQLESFALINVVAARKIVKKWNKHAPSRDARLDFAVVLASCAFAEGNGDQPPDDLRSWIEETERVFARRFHGGDATLARCELLSKQTRELEPVSFHLGVRVGACFALFLWIVFDFVVDGEGKKSRILESSGLAVYRWVGCGVLMLFCWAALLRAWVRCRVNYIYILELPNDQDWRRALTRATSACAAYLASLLLYTKAHAGDFPRFRAPALLHPIILALASVLYVVYIFLNSPALSETLYKALTTWARPGGSVRFRDTLMADVLTSVIKAIKDVFISACYVLPVLLRGRNRACSSTAAECALCVDPTKPFRLIVMPLVSASPLLLRFVQCVSRYYSSRFRWPHLYNATKYTGSLLMVAIGMFHTDALPTFGMESTKKKISSALYLFIFLSSTFYSFWWDLSQDWGLNLLRRRPFAKDYVALRERLATYRWCYYLAIGFDFFGRFVWTLTLVSERSSPWYVYVSPFLAPIEILRRASWMFFRVECQQFHNLDRYANMNWVPLHFNVKADGGADDSRTERGVLVEAAIFLTAVVLILVFATQ